MPGPSLLYARQAMINDGAILLYALNGNALDDTAFVRNGTILTGSGAVTFGQALTVRSAGPDTAVLFSGGGAGGGGFIRTPALPRINAYSIECYYASFSDGQGNLSRIWGSTNFDIDLGIAGGAGGNHLEFFDGAWNDSGVGLLASEGFAHLVYTFDGTACNLYKNSINILSFASGHGRVISANDVFALGNSVSNDAARKGTMYCFAIYPYALSSQQVSNHFNTPTTVVFNGVTQNPIIVQQVTQPVPVTPPLGNSVVYTAPPGVSYIIATVDDDYLAPGQNANVPFIDNSGNTPFLVDKSNDPFSNLDDVLGDGMRDDDDEDEDEDDDEFLVWP